MHGFNAFFNHDREQSANEIVLAVLRILPADIEALVDARFVPDTL